LFASKSIPASARFGDALDIPKLRELKSHSFLSSWTNSHEEAEKESYDGDAFFSSKQDDVDTFLSTKQDDGDTYLSAKQDDVDTFLSTKRDVDEEIRCHHLQFKEEPVDVSSKREETDQRRKNWLQANRAHSW
jgi:hypothetical protein